MTDSASSESSPAPLPSLLLIDDDPISREVLSMVLGIHGFPVATAESGLEAISLLEQTPAEVILMDTQMPGLSGLELIRKLRQHQGTRIIAISGSEVSTAVRDAADGFLLKPVDPEQLVELLDASTRASSQSVEQTAPVSGNPQSELPDGLASDRPVIDPAVLSRLRVMMPSQALREIYEAVAADLKLRLVALSAAMDCGDAAEVARLAHSIKGGSAMVGFVMASEAASRLEASNRDETWPKELLQLRYALSALERILGDEFPI